MSEPPALAGGQFSSNQSCEPQPLKFDLNMDSKSEKYKQLFEYSKSVFDKEYERFKILEQKATQYLSILTLLIGVSTFFVKWVVDNFVPPRNLAEWILVILATSMFTTLTVAWFRAFSVIRVFSLSVLTHDKALIDFWVAENEEYIYYDRASKISEALKANKQLMDQKTKKLISAYKWISASIMFLILFSFAFGSYNWLIQPTRDKHMTEPKESNTATEPSTPEPSNQPSGNTPQPSSDVPAPPLGKVEYGEKIPEIRDPWPTFTIKND